MKTTLFAISTLILSFTVLAQESRSIAIEVPYPSHQGLFYGTIGRLEAGLFAKLKAKAAAACGTNENVALISNVEAKFRFSSITTEETIFEGSYPMGAVTAVVYCQE